MKAPQLQADKVLHGFVSRLASSRAQCSSSDATTDRTASPGAKQLSCFLSSSTGGNRDATCSFPSLDLVPRANKFAPPAAALSRPPRTSDAHAIGSTSTSTSNSCSPAAQNLGRPVRFNKMDIQDAPSQILSSFCTSFQTIVDERLRRSALTLIQSSIVQSRKADMDDATAKAHANAIKRLFPSSTRPPIAITAAVSNWVTLPKKEGKQESSSSDPPLSRHTTGKPSLVQPIILELVVDVSILGGADKATIRLTVPGTIRSVFSRFTFRLETVCVELDTDVLLASTSVQCDGIVQRAVERAYRECFFYDSSATTTTTTATITTETSAAAAARSQERKEQEEVDDDDAVDVDRKMMPPPPPRPPPTGQISSSSIRKRKHVEAAAAADVPLSSRTCTRMRKTSLSLLTPAA